MDAAYPIEENAELIVKQQSYIKIHTSFYFSIWVTDFGGEVRNYFTWLVALLLFEVIYEGLYQTLLKSIRS